MGEVGKNHLLEAGGLIGDGLGQHRMGMAVKVTHQLLMASIRVPPFTNQQSTVSGHHPWKLDALAIWVKGGHRSMADRLHGSSGSFCH